MKSYTSMKEICKPVNQVFLNISIEEVQFGIFWQQNNINLIYTFITRKN